MNLKEAFRFQNKLQAMIDEVLCILNTPSNITTVENTYMRKKVMAETEDETVLEKPDCEYSEKITMLTDFLMFLLGERERLSKAIRKVKSALPLDMDSEVSLNSKRQDVCKTLRRMDAIRSNEVVISNGGSGYRFNAEGNQVSYRCDVKRVTTINFDRKAIRRDIKQLNEKIDSISAEIDRCLVNASVEYDVPFDVNDTLYTIFEDLSERKDL